jgi:hypothetical protein
MERTDAQMGMVWYGVVWCGVEWYGMDSTAHLYRIHLGAKMMNGQREIRGDRPWR